jgi:hypothetical protein
MTAARSLRMIKVLHSLVWAFFVACIVAIPVLAWRERFAASAVMISFVLVEVVVLLANDWSCPLTAVASRYTDDRRANFDIYLPLWLARHNKTVFGWLFVLGSLFTLFRYLA